jgi:hypothetical protein
MRGVYARAHFDDVPTDDAVGRMFRKEVTVCHHDDVGGGVCFECVADWGTAQSVAQALTALGGENVTGESIRCIEWYSDSMLAAGGRVVSWDLEANAAGAAYGVSCHRSPAWWAANGWLAFHVDAVDVAHPRAIQTAPSAHAFMTQLERVWKM